MQKKGVVESRLVTQIVVLCSQSPTPSTSPQMQQGYWRVAKSFDQTASFQNGAGQDDKVAVQYFSLSVQFLSHWFFFPALAFDAVFPVSLRHNSPCP